MRKKLFVMAALALGMAANMTLTSCGDDDEPTPQEQPNDPNGGDDNGNTPGGTSTTVDTREYVDLGLPSGTLWATCNIGALKPENAGLFFAWGEVLGYTHDKSDGRSFDASMYKWCNGSNTSMTKYCDYNLYGADGFEDGLRQLLPEDDAAYVCWGADWRMPTWEQMLELNHEDNTVKEWTMQNGVKGWRYTSKVNGNSIFLPITGFRRSKALYVESSEGYYWSSSLPYLNPSAAFCLTFDSKYAGANGNEIRTQGFAVRPVRNQ